MGYFGHGRYLRRHEGWRWIAPLGLLLALFLCILGAPGSASADIPSSVWAPSCSPNSTDTSTVPGARCIAGARLPSRGWYGVNPACVLEPPLPGMIYPSTTFCGRRGGEAIEQSRVISHLGAVVGGVNPDVQWEVGLYQNNPPSGETVGRRRVDVVYYDHTDASKPLQVYELKQTSNPDYGSRGSQMLQYVNLLNGVTNTGATPGTVLHGWTDLFLVDTGVACTGDPSLHLLDVYISWESDSGLFDIYKYQPPRARPAAGGRPDLGTAADGAARSAVRRSTSLPGDAVARPGNRPAAASEPGSGAEPEAAAVARAGPAAGTG
jgi:hypothetical protein